MYAMGYLQQAGTNATGWLLLLLLGIVILVLAVWWLFRRVDRMQAEALSERNDVPRRDNREDDLKKIEGIGPKVEKVLKNAGIKSYESLSRADAANIQNVLNEAGLQMMSPEGWIEQANLAAKRDWAGLQKLQGELKGGRRK